ncbi:MAG: EEP domain-containing protein [Xanthomonadales bacterium]|nr:EEP domain-containing protein [Xanthomonadales bacterium]
MSFNIHAGTTTDRYHHYLTHGWRQVLPHHQRTTNLDGIAELVSDFDLVALQEVDSGSLRSGFINQASYIASHAGLPHWYHQANRKVGNMSLSGNSFMGRLAPNEIEEHRLPGAIPGRGFLLLRFGGGGELTVAIVHLALGRRARTQQLEYIADELSEEQRLLVMGDFNTGATSPEMHAFCRSLSLAAPTAGLPSYPAWQPQRAIDHILVSESLSVHDARALDAPMSDHCPVAVTLDAPVALPVDADPSADPIAEGLRAGLS